MKKPACWNCGTRRGITGWHVQMFQGWEPTCVNCLKEVEDDDEVEEVLALWPPEPCMCTSVFNQEKCYFISEQYQGRCNYQYNLVVKGRWPTYVPSKWKKVGL